MYNLREFQTLPSSRTGGEACANIMLKSKELCDVMQVRRDDNVGTDSRWVIQIRCGM